MIATLALGMILAAAPAAGVVPVGLERAPAAPVARAPQDTLTRVPGCRLRLGWPHERTATLGSFPVSRQDARSEVREGEIRWFGEAAKATLTYREGRLAQVRLVSSVPTPRLASYAGDQLLRMGYRLQGATVSGPTRTADYEGPCRVHLVTSATIVQADVTPRAEPVAEAPAASDSARVSPADSTTLVAAGSASAPASLPADTSAVDLTAPADSSAVPLRTHTPEPPMRPRIAVDAGVFGRVPVRVLVGADGSVRSARVVRSIPELDNAAIDWASRVRYAPYLRNGVPTPFIVVIPVAFLPGHDAPGGRP